MRLWVPLLLLVVAIGACGDPATVSTGESDALVTEPAASEAAADPTSAPADDSAGTISVEGTDLGAILVDEDGNTLYLLTTDDQGASTCYDDCEANWPVLEGPVEAGDGVDEALLGETMRDDGTVQTTYNDWPLYYFAGDAQAGDINGQGVGDVWYVLDASGEPVKDGANNGARDY